MYFKKKAYESNYDKRILHNIKDEYSIVIKENTKWDSKILILFQSSFFVVTDCNIQYFKTHFKNEFKANDAPSFG